MINIVISILSVSWPQPVMGTCIASEITGLSKLCVQVSTRNWISEEFNDIFEGHQWILTISSWILTISGAESGEGEEEET